ncbi:LuxR C-terminal-related transcriptional regulator [Shewanella sp. 5_MG-2023]|uniref:LuxR C-terminal-related transcriptional regulator n=1 Tax=Shewanella sp. 5_MG-2023 TaxID=3062656 RepID=UPI0026E2164F|nr:LuxR C-terminal-related transcriptional regulator [Shewanella sp. 5_MG-2023]MDO6639334.1 LuxR C-terminal-related transcriptional regulator [Shewanella sp. 5_MG-2023]
MFKQTLFLVMKLSIQSRAISDFLKTNLGCETLFISSERELSHLENTSNPLLLVDVADLPNIDESCWDSLFNEDINQVHTVLLNTAQNFKKRDLLDWPNCCGVFPKSCSLDLLERGMRKILAGECWLPRTMMSELLQHYRKDETPSEQQAVSLTRRERDVLKLLTPCNSNIDIANALFVSEHTVKSHLYKIFKKTEVKNRIQAVNWAKVHIHTI